MSNPIEKYWGIRLAECKQALEKNNFEVFMADSLADAKRVFDEEVKPALGNIRTVTFGGSDTVAAAGVAAAVRADDSIVLIDPYDQSVSAEEQYERRRQGLLADLFLTSTNAVSSCGKLINLDGTCNRIAAITFGPKNVVLFIGRNKIVDTVDDAMFRVKDYAAPVNAMRLSRKTPCVSTSQCMDCSSPQRICNAWAITEKSFPAKRIKIILINEDCGF